MAMPLIPCDTEHVTPFFSLGQCILKAVRKLQVKGSVGNIPNSQILQVYTFGGFRSEYCPAVIQI